MNWSLSHKICDCDYTYLDLLLQKKYKTDKTKAPKNILDGELCNNSYLLKGNNSIKKEILVHMFSCEFSENILATSLGVFIYLQILIDLQRVNDRMGPTSHRKYLQYLCLVCFWNLYEQRVTEDVVSFRSALLSMKNRTGCHHLSHFRAISDA